MLPMVSDRRLERNLERFSCVKVAETEHRPNETLAGAEIGALRGAELPVRVMVDYVKLDLLRCWTTRRRWRAPTESPERRWDARCHVAGAV